MWLPLCLLPFVAGAALYSDPHLLLPSVRNNSKPTYGFWVGGRDSVDVRVHDAAVLSVEWRSLSHVKHVGQKAVVSVRSVSEEPNRTTEFAVEGMRYAVTTDAIASVDISVLSKFLVRREVYDFRLIGKNRGGAIFSSLNGTGVKWTYDRKFLRPVREKVYLEWEDLLRVTAVRDGETTVTAVVESSPDLAAAISISIGTQDPSAEN